MNKYWINIVLLFFLQGAFAQSSKYWVYTAVNQEQTREIVAAAGGEVIVFSHWLGAASATLNHQQVEALRKVTHVDSIVLLNAQLKVLRNSYWHREPVKERYGFALEQIGAQRLIKDGLTGKGVKIGIIDGGFLEADQSRRLTHLFDDGRIVATRDFITPDLGPYEGSKLFDDGHGKSVWEMIGGYDHDKDIHFGLAREASYYLARTDDGRKEYRGEEDLLIAALEWMDSLGVKLVNISIGYSKGYDNPAENYRPEQMDGKSVALTRAAQIATEEKGMLLVVAGGNDGEDDQWNVVSTPGDAEGVLTVGASKLKRLERIKYSSIGGEFLPFLKPEIACFSSSGTSFAAPIITGLAACLWQHRPELTNTALKTLIEKSAVLYPYGNNYVGYGYPVVKRCLILADQEEENWNLPQEISSGKNKWTAPELEEGELVTIFHKKDWKNVLSQQSIKSTGKKMKVRREEGAARTTVIFPDQVYEIIWPAR